MEPLDEYSNIFSPKQEPIRHSFVKIRNGLETWMISALLGSWMTMSLEAVPWVAVAVEHGGEPVVIDGLERLAHEPANPASTFKIVLAWAGIESGTLDTDTTFPCDDVDGALRPVTLAEAMRRSSNQYFEQWVAEFGRENVGPFVHRSFFFDQPLPNDWLGSDARSVVRGGTMTITPMQLARFCRQLADGAISSSSETHAKLDSVLIWEKRENAVLYAKSGAYGGAAWLAGYMESRDSTLLSTVLPRNRRTALVVMVPYQVPHWRPARAKAVAEFERLALAARPVLR